MRHPFWKSALVGVSFIALVSLSPGTGHAAGGDKTLDDLREIGRLYADLEYEQAFVQLQRARSLARDVNGKVALSLYEGILWCEMGNFVLGQVSFREALLVRPDVKLPMKVAPKVEKSFEATRLAVAHEKALLAALREPAAVEEPPAPRARGAPAQAEDTKKAAAQAVNQSAAPVPVASAPPPPTSAPVETTSQQPSEEVAVDVASERAALMKRLGSVSERFRDMNSVLPLSALQQLSAIGRQIRAATSRAEFLAASSAIDAWAMRNLGSAQSTP
ncbi:TPR domain protein [Cystobacter fuscus]|uniref:TPR domain protein n=1 Tax=Cystobacter fuscus TaxID=43 RepID=A0A250IUV7_9BACT|nr:hypothetical protein [Cystobacter fuscus]ATB34941.1 TPR domain protein [Cystobacter fuscus]